MKKQAENASKYLVHNLRNSLVHIKLLHRQLEKISLDIEKTLNTYREMIDEVVNEYENRLSNGQNSKDE